MGTVAMTGRQKAAVFCIHIGAEKSAKMLKFLQDDEVEQLVVEIAQAKRVNAEERSEVLAEFVQMTHAKDGLRKGGVEYARDLLEKALGEERTAEILQRLTSSFRKRPFDAIRRADPANLSSFLQNEHPQTIAVVIAHLDPSHAAVVLAGLPPERQVDVFKRVSIIERTSPEMLREAERVLERKLSAMAAQESTAAGGIAWAVEVLNRADRATERKIMEALETDDPALAEEIAKRMFLFENIVMLDDKSIQRILREVDMNHDLPLALKASKEEVWKRILANVSKRTAESLKEAVEFLGPVRIRDVEEAQARIVAMIRRLEDRGEIQISRGGGENEFI